MVLPSGVYRDPAGDEITTEGRSASVKHTSPPRVFVLGAPRTGTTSLAIYLEEAGVPTKHFFPEEAGYIDFAPADDNARAVLAYIAAAPETAFCDHPVRAVWRELADAYPDAHFILTRRESPQKWRASAERYFAELGAAVDLDAAYLDYVVTNARIEDLRIPRATGWRPCRATCGDSTRFA